MAPRILFQDLEHLEMITANNPNTTSSSAATISQHFHELKEDIVSFNEAFSIWLGDKRRLIHDDKNVYLKTLAEEHGKCVILYFNRGSRGFKETACSVTTTQARITGEYCNPVYAFLALEAEQKEVDQGVSINEELRVQQALLTDKGKQLNTRLEQLTQSNEREASSMTGYAINFHFVSTSSKTKIERCHESTQSSTREFVSRTLGIAC